MIIRLALALALAATGTSSAPVSVAHPVGASAFAIAVQDAVARSATEKAPPDDTRVTKVSVVVPTRERPGVLASRVAPEASSTLVADTVSGGRVVSPVMPTSGFQTVGVTWPEGADGTHLGAQVRTRSTNGTWSTWQALVTSDDAPDVGSPDAEHATRGGTDPLWVGDSDAVQVSFDAGAGVVPDDLSLTLVDVPASSSTASNAVASGGASVSAALYTTTATATPGVPHIITREEWGARPQVCQPDVATKLVGAVLHHTAGSNTYSTIAEAERQIRGDQAYHIDGRGWCDIGYNFVVDKWGNIYEGRDNSLTEPVIGVHAGGFNTGTVGVSMLGTYDAAPSQATQTAVAEIIGYRLGYYGVNPEGTFVYHTLGGENSRYTVADVSLPRVFGHRDVAYTACPGNGGYAALPAIRAMAASFSYGERFRQARSVVQAMYEDILGRAVDPSGLDTWSAMLVDGVGLPALVASLTDSDEYVRIRIREAYVDTLGREPEPAGMDNWYRAIRAGVATVDDVERHFLSSGEFLSKAGGTDAGYVERMYTSVLGRSPAPAEVDFWLGQIAAHGRESVTDSIWFSLEAAKYRAGAYYQTFLKRDPDAQGVLTWAGVLLSKGEGAVRIGIAGSEEYRARALVRYP